MAEHAFAIAVGQWMLAAVVSPFLFWRITRSPRPRRSRAHRRALLVSWVLAFTSVVSAHGAMPMPASVSLLHLALRGEPGEALRFGLIPLMMTYVLWMGLELVWGLLRSVGSIEFGSRDGE